MRQPKRCLACGRRQCAAFRSGRYSTCIATGATVGEVREDVENDTRKNRLSHRPAVISETATEAWKAAVLADQFAKGEHVLGPESMDHSVVAAPQLSRRRVRCVKRKATPTWVPWLQSHASLGSNRPAPAGACVNTLGLPAVAQALKRDAAHAAFSRLCDAGSHHRRKWVEFRSVSEPRRWELRRQLQRQTKRSPGGRRRSNELAQGDARASSCQAGAAACRFACLKNATT